MIYINWKWEDINWIYVNIDNEDYDDAGDDGVVLPFCWGQRHGEEGDEQQQGCHQVQPGRRDSLSTKIKFKNNHCSEYVKKGISRKSK